MKALIKYAVVLLIFLSHFDSPIKAAHLAGGTLSYEYIGDT